VLLSGRRTGFAGYPRLVEYRRELRYNSLRTSFQLAVGLAAETPCEMERARVACGG
jgi:hypothetical protein